MKTRPTGIGTVNADWMGVLPSKLSAMPLKHLAVPGSHDSFTFWVDVEAPVGPDQKVYVQYLATMFSAFAKKVMVKWSMTQNMSFREQLDAGIRYFDLRISSKPGEPGIEVFFIHGLFGHKVRDGLLEISSFLSRHKKEVVFLDFNHFYAMDAEHHAYLINMLQEVFGSRLCNDCAVEGITLDYLWEKKYQVIVFYHHTSGQGVPVMWPGSKIPAPWANTIEPDKLVQFLDTTLKERNKQGSFHVSQAILTPRVNTVAKGLLWGLRSYLVEKSVTVWLCVCGSVWLRCGVVCGCKMPPYMAYITHHFTRIFKEFGPSVSFSPFTSEGYTVRGFNVILKQRRKPDLQSP